MVVHGLRREWYYNRGSMLELVRLQRKKLPMVAGAEEIVLSAGDILASETNLRSKKIKETGKYGDIINTTLEMKAKRQISLYINTWI